MNHTINNLLLPTFSNAQRFLVTLLCGMLQIYSKVMILIDACLSPHKNIVIIEYYEDKRKKESQEITELFDENKSLRDEMKKLRTEMRLLRENNRNLSSKLRSANNMIRILTKTRENADECKTPTKGLNLLSVEHLLKEKINNKALVSSNLNFKKVKFDFRTENSNSKVKPNEATKPNNKSILKLRNEEPNNLKNILKKIENKQSTTSSFIQSKPRLLTTRKNLTSKNNSIKEPKNTEESRKLDAVQKLRENWKKEIPKGALTSRFQPHREVKRAHLEPFNYSRSCKQNNNINDETYVIE
ncbi:hypothetical protein TSAR_015662 [Trichomalopsis sarcophagae]|uniref:Uncharacterized protein n=1 Tax=Trichomalopsis sarcophagae TaxID=543379 RepID=A0A232EX24_9HYME|nr:hypothetical protein TSAR_015662 [Trichomalopsis sarcophagae]